MDASTVKESRHPRADGGTSSSKPDAVAAPVPKAKAAKSKASKPDGQQDNFSGFLAKAAAGAQGMSDLAQSVANAVVDQANGTIPGQDAITYGTINPEQGTMGNQATFEAQAKAIANAKSEVVFESFTWHDCDNAKDITNALKQLEANQKARGPKVKPVQVYMLMDASLPHEGAYRLMKGMVDADHLDSKLVNVHLIPYHHLLNGVSHAKALVIDRKTAYVTGANPQFDDGYPQYDLGSEFQGPIVHSIWEDEVATMKKAQSMPLDWVVRHVESLFGKHPDDLKGLEDGKWPQQLPQGKEVPMVLETQAANAGIFTNPKTPAVTGAEAMLANFKNNYRMITPNLNSKPRVAGIIAGALAGKHFQILLSKDFNQSKENEIGQGGANDKVIKNILTTLTKDGCAQNVEFRWFSHDGKTPSEPGENSHAKYDSADGQVAVLETLNGDTQSEHSHEIGVMVDDATKVQQIDNDFFAPVWNVGVPVTLATLADEAKHPWVKPAKLDTA